MLCQIVYRTLNFKFHFDMLLLTWLRASENFDYKLKISKKIVYLTFLKVVHGTVRENKCVPWFI